jgi:nucleoside-triphosphatase THEP1
MDGPAVQVMMLWTGPKHSGKSTAAAQLAEQATTEGFSVAGILAPAIYRRGRLIGFDGVNLATGRRRPLTRRVERGRGHVGPFAFTADGLGFGNAALTSPAARAAALVIVDEFGPLELRGDGWRTAADQLISSFRGVLLLVVREALVDDVLRLYARCRPEPIRATEPAAATRMLRLLRRQRARAAGHG